MRKLNDRRLPNSVLKERNELSQETKLKILKSVSFKYKLMGIRSKISYYAFINKKTVAELIISQILKTYEHFLQQNQYQLTEAEQLMMEPDVMDTVNSESVSDIMRKIIRINATSLENKQELF